MVHVSEHGLLNLDPDNQTVKLEAEALYSTACQRERYQCTSCPHAYILIPCKHMC